MSTNLATENLIKSKTSRGFDEICGKVEAACKEQGFSVLSDLNLAEKMRSKGVEFGGACRIFEFCNPQSAANVLRENMDAATMLPCRLAVYQSAQDNGETVIASVAPTKQLSLIDAPNAQQEVEEIENSVRAIIKTLAS